MNELHDQDRAFDEAYEPDWHQQDKDDRAQGMHLDPEPPDEGEPPLSLDVIGQLLDVVKTNGPFSPALREALGYEDDRPDTPAEAVDLLLGVALPQLLAQRRRDQDELAEWRALPYRDDYSVYWPASDGPDGCEGHRTWYPSAEKALAVAEEAGGKPETRRFYDGPRVELQTSPF